MADSPSVDDAIRLRAYQLWAQERTPPTIAADESRPKKGDSSKKKAPKKSGK